MFTTAATSRAGISESEAGAVITGLPVDPVSFDPVSVGASVSSDDTSVVEVDTSVDESRPDCAIWAPMKPPKTAATTTNDNTTQRRRDELVAGAERSSKDGGGNMSVTRRLCLVDATNVSSSRV
jgi:hypothetical protein